MSYSYKSPNRLRNNQYSSTSGYLRTAADLVEEEEELKNMILQLRALVTSMLGTLEKITGQLADLAREVNDIKNAVYGASRRDVQGREGRYVNRRHGRTSSHGRTTRTAMDILRDTGVVFEEDIAGKIRNRDSFFSKLEKMGAVVIATDKQRAAFTREFLEAFEEQLNRMGISSEEEALEKLRGTERRVFIHLRDAGALLKASDGKRWRLVIPSPSRNTQ